jgi:hypothetical protein
MFLKYNVVYTHHKNRPIKRFHPATRMDSCGHGAKKEKNSFFRQRPLSLLSRRIFVAA